jgi:pyrimidine-nucleoside phosphorylase
MGADDFRAFSGHHRRNPGQTRKHSGFNVALGERQALAQLAAIGVFMIGQTADICPADRKLYALRDVTATVPSMPLIVSSIMSKKLAENLDRLVIDVKFGSGAFMKNRQEAEALGSALAAVGREFSVETKVLFTPMDEPLGLAVGNALEVAEAVETLQGGGPRDLIDLTLNLAAEVATVSRTRLEKWLQDGTAWRKFVRLVEAQNGDARALEQMETVHAAPIRRELPARRAGTVTKMDAGQIGRACIVLGAGRARAIDDVDFAVGCSHLQKVGARVERGAPLLLIHARNAKSLEAAVPLFESAVELED